MALSFKDKETDRLPRDVAALTGETSTDAIRKALAERLERERLRRGGSARLADRLMQLGRECAALPDCDTRSPDEIVGYNETGMWR
jgi:antitoxin VapB